MRQLYTNEHYERALEILAATPATAELKDWICEKCNEKNPGNFSVCWKCPANS